MPFYEFKCPQCEAVRDLRLPVEERGVTAWCDYCQQHTMKRVFSPQEVHMEGRAFINFPKGSV